MLGGNGSRDCLNWKHSPMALILTVWDELNSVGSDSLTGPQLTDSHTEWGPLGGLWLVLMTILHRWCLSPPYGQHQAFSM